MKPSDTTTSAECELLRAVNRLDSKDAEAVVSVFPCPSEDEINNAIQTLLQIYTATGGESRPLAKHIRGLMLAYVKGVREWEGW